MIVTYNFYTDIRGFSKENSAIRPAVMTTSEFILHIYFIQEMLKMIKLRISFSPKLNVLVR